MLCSVIAIIKNTTDLSKKRYNILSAKIFGLMVYSMNKPADILVHSCLLTPLENSFSHQPDG